MKLIVQPDAGAAPLVTSIKQAKRLHVRAIIVDGRRAFLGSQSLRRIELDERRETGRRKGARRAGGRGFTSLIGWHPVCSEASNFLAPRPAGRTHLTHTPGGALSLPPSLLTRNRARLS
jgi:hypothetical protein